MKFKYKVGDKVTLTHLETVEPDIPKRYIGRSGIVRRRSAVWNDEPPLYNVEFKGRKNRLCLYEDEITLSTGRAA